MKMVLCKLKADTVISIQSDRNCQNKRFQKVCFRKLEQTFFVRARPCFQDGVFRVPKNGMLETNKPLAMRVVGNALAYRKNLQCYNNAGSPTALQAEEVSIWI